MESLTQRERQVLLELLKNAKISDQEIARRLGTSRPTVIKIRQKLERTLIRKYTATLDYHDIGLRVIAHTFFRWDDFSRRKEMQQVFSRIAQLPFVIRFSSGMGMGSMTNIIVSVHEDLEAYEAFWADLQEKGGEDISEVQAFLSSTRNMHKKHEHTAVFVDYLSQGAKARK